MSRKLPTPNPMESPYSNRELDHMFIQIKEQLDRIEAQTERTNGRVTRIEKTLLVSGSVVLVTLFFKAPELFNLVRHLIA